MNHLHTILYMEISLNVRDQIYLWTPVGWIKIDSIQARTKNLAFGFSEFSVVKSKEGQPQQNQCIECSVLIWNTLSPTMELVLLGQT